MKIITEKLYQIINAQMKNLSNGVIFFDKKKINVSLSSFSAPGLSYIYTYNFKTQEFKYLNPDSQGLNGIEYNGTNTSLVYLNRIHPDDTSHVKRCIKLAYYFYSTFIDKNKIPFYKVTYQFRIKNKSGKYKLILHEGVLISTDKEGKVLNLIGVESDISHITRVNNHNVSFVEVRGGKSFYNIKNKEDLLNSDTSVNKDITDREIEILKLLMDGLSSKEIANHLHISYDTVRTHRNNILKKSKFKTLTQLISHYIKEGLL